MLGRNWLDERRAEGIGYIRAVGTMFPRQLLVIIPDMQNVGRQTFEVFVEKKKTKTSKSTPPLTKVSEV